MTILFILTIIILLILWILNNQKLQKIITTLKTENANQQRHSETLSLTIRKLEANNFALNKYQGIVDIAKKAEEILTDAEIRSHLLIENAKQELEQAEKSAQEIKNQATSDATSYKQNAINILNNASYESRLIIEQANTKAEEIAGDAYKAMKNAAELEKTVRAMKNIIEGYGDRYLIPTYSLLDDLAEEFGHTEGGARLKMARETTSKMIKNNLSARCDYVESYRRETAINFILDAFNGKVDSILSKVKKDNYGTLEQKIKDAYQVVNNNGKAFRNAVITEAYLKARLDELKWAIITQELKWEEQEEQRQIKEQIRDEERANREFEKAIRETQKEEELLSRLIEKVQKEVDLASAEQKAKLEAKLSELEVKLKIAEERNQRALSMAQQTKCGNVYVISNIGSFGEDVYKIGMTRRLEPLDRIRELGDASVPFDFDVHSMIFSENAPDFERTLHKKFLRLQLNKVNPRKEFFKVTLSDIKNEIENMGITAKWTMKAEARNYRESLAIEEAFKNDKLKQLEWEKYQLQLDPITVDVDENSSELN